MMLLDIFNLEAEVKKDKLFLKKYKTYIKMHSLEDSLNLIKLSGLCIEKFQNSKRKRLLESLLKEIKETFNNDPQISRFIREIESLNYLFRDIENLREEVGLNSIPENKQIVSFLTAIEVLLGSNREYCFGRNIVDIKRVYPFVFAAIDEQNNLADPIKLINLLGQINDSLAENAGYVLRFLKKSGFALERIKTTFLNNEDIKLSREHANLYDKWTVLDALEQNWRYFGDEVIQKVHNVSLRITSDRLHQSLEISKTRFRNQKHKWQFDFQASNKKNLNEKVNSNSTSLVPNEYLDEEEALYAICLGEFLSIRNLDIEISGVKLTEYLRAIMVIKMEMRNVLNKRNTGLSVQPLVLTNWCSVRKKNEWLKLFESRGISHQSANILIGFLTFNDNSRDLLDCPFIEYNDSLIVIPSLAAMIDPSMTIISHLSKMNANISFKGNGFENEIVEKLKAQGIPCSKIKVIDAGKPFECDCVFVIDDDLFFVECKHIGQVFSPRDYYNFLVDLTGPNELIFSEDRERSYTEQLGRISNYYIEHLDHIRRRLNLSQEWVPRNTYKVILTNLMLGENLQVNDCYVVDSSTFQRFIDREPPGFSIGKVTVRPQHECFEGKITTDKLLSVMTNCPQIKISTKRIDKEIKEFRLLTAGVMYEQYINKIGDFVHLDKESLDELIEKWNIPKELLRNDSLQN